MAKPTARRHDPREEPGALTRPPGSVRGDRGNPVPYRDCFSMFIGLNWVVEPERRGVRLLPSRGATAPMTALRRDQIRDEVLAELDLLGQGFPASSRQTFLESGDSDWDRSWHFFACAYSNAFDVLWDAAYERRSGILNYPLLFVARHGIELWIKAAVCSVLQGEPRSGHNLGDLWRDLMVAWKNSTGSAVDDMYTDSVQCAIRILDAHDGRGDRFRYPTSIAGRNSPAKPYESTEADLVELYRAHSVITGFCAAVVTEMEISEFLTPSILL